MRRQVLNFFLGLTLLSGVVPAQAQEAAYRAEERAALLSALASARSKEVAKAAEDALWLLWTRAPDGQAQALLDAAMMRMKARDTAGALELLDTLVAYAPDYAEGWNQRAFAHFRMQQFDRSLEDIDKALQREPSHFGALAGKVRILMIQGRMPLAQEALREAVAIHPWLAERSLVLDLPENAAGKRPDD